MDSLDHNIFLEALCKCAVVCVWSLFYCIYQLKNLLELKYLEKIVPPVLGIKVGANFSLLLFTKLKWLLVVISI